MRRRSISRDEIRFNGSRITTLPIDSVREDECGRLDTIEALFAPLLRELNREQQEDWDSKLGIR